MFWCANSLIPWFDDPLGHLSSRLLTPSGLNIPAMLTLFEALLGLVNIDIDHTSIEVLPPDAVEGQTPDIVVTESPRTSDLAAFHHGHINGKSKSSRNVLDFD